MTKMILPLLAVLATAGLIATGCGGDDDDEAPGAVATENGDQDEAEVAAGPEGEVEQVVRDFMTGLATADADTACPLVTDEFLAESWAEPGQEAPSCEELFALIAEFNDDETIEVGGEMVPVEELDEIELDVEVSDDGRSATVTAADDPEKLRLERRGDRWLIVGSE